MALGCAVTFSQKSRLSMSQDSQKIAMMPDANQGLLPIGLQDQLPPDAEREAEVLEGIMRMLGSHGFDRVKPPLLEFEQTLLANAPAKLRRRSFRVVDPLSRETLVLRSDMTGQVGRMAATRLAETSRPLRLSYGGQVVRVTGSDLRPERQFTQVGAEIVGVSDGQQSAAILEVAHLALAGVHNSGIENVVIDLVVPGVVARICAAHDHEVTEDLLSAIAARDPVMLSDFACGECLSSLTQLMGAAGPWRESLVVLGDLLTADDRDRVRELAEALEATHPSIAITLDPAETRGFEYHDRLGFVLCAPSVRGELGRGGAYRTAHAEASVGFTLYLDSLVRALGPQTPPPYVYLPIVHREDLTQILAQGMRVRLQLADAKDQDALRAEAVSMNCHAIWDGQNAVPL